MKLNPEYVKVASKMIDESPYLKLLGTTTELLVPAITVVAWSLTENIRTCSVALMGE